MNNHINNNIHHISKQTLFKNVFLTRSVLPDGKTPDVPGIGGSPSFCSRLSATTRNALRPILIRSGVSINLIGRPTLNKSYTISRIAKSNRSFKKSKTLFTISQMHYIVKSITSHKSQEKVPETIKNKMYLGNELYNFNKNV